MIRLTTFPILMCILLISCAERAENKNPQGSANIKEERIVSIRDTNTAAFYDKLSSLCGKAFEGHEVFFKQGRESWAAHRLIISFTHCEEAEVHIRLFVGEDKSRTWMFINDNGYLHFRHDHRHEDGTPEDLTLYGGYATAHGTAYRQIFPADGYTIAMQLSTEGSFWVIELAEDLSSFCYKLFHEDDLLFHGTFDLSNEKEITETV